MFKTPFSVDMHVNYILSICSKCIFLLKRLRDQGLPVKHLNTVFQALIISRLLYALPSWGCFLPADLSGKIDAFLRRAHRYGLAANILTVSELFDSVAQDFFSKIPSPDHCRHSVLPEEKTSSLALRPRGHQFQLPSVFIGFLAVANRTNGRAVGTMLRPSVVVICTECIVAKRCVLVQLLLRAYRKSYMRNRLVPK